MATRADSFKITVDPIEMRNLLSVLSALPKETQQGVRDRALPLSQRLAGQLFMFANAAPAPQTKLVAQSIKPVRDRLVRVDVGGTKKVGRKYGGETSKSGKAKVRQVSAPAGALLWGTEYGSKPGVDSLGRRYTSRFKVGRSHSGYWMNPAIDYYAPVVANEYIDMIKGVIHELRLD